MKMDYISLSWLFVIMDVLRMRLTCFQVLSPRILCVVLQSHVMDGRKVIIVQMADFLPLCVALRKKGYSVQYDFRL